MMNKWSFHIRILALGAILFSSCYYDVESELYPFSTCSSTNASYTSDIVPIVRRSCFSCHSNDNAPENGNVNLESYENLVHYVHNGMLMGSIHHENGFEPMPQNASKLSDCEISKIESWIAHGAFNN
jgi:hypothetical protein